MENIPQLRILWCTFDRTSRASPLHDTFQTYVAKYANVTFIRRPIPKKAGLYFKEIIQGKTKVCPVVEKVLEDNPPFDFIYIDALTAFFSDPWQNIQIPKGVFFGDVHHSIVTQWMFKFIYKFNMDLLVHCYDASFKKQRPEIYQDFQRIWLPLSIDPTLFKDYGENKQYDVLHIGSIHKKIYPIRTRLYNTLKNKKYLTRIDRPPENEMDPTKKWPVGEDYARVLNQSKVVINCSSKYHYPVEKYFEIPACNALLFADYIPELGRLGFVPNNNMIAINIKKASDQIDMILNCHSTKFTEIVKSGMELVHTYHTMDIRAKQFINDLCVFLGRSQIYKIENDYRTNFPQEG